MRGPPAGGANRLGLLPFHCAQPATGALRTTSIGAAAGSPARREGSLAAFPPAGRLRPRPTRQASSARPSLRPRGPPLSSPPSLCRSCRNSRKLSKIQAETLPATLSTGPGEKDALSASLLPPIFAQRSPRAVCPRPLSRCVPKVPHVCQAPLGPELPMCARVYPNRVPQERLSKVPRA